VNTVYTPPPRRFAETETASPLRRTVESRGAAAPQKVETGSDAAPRRATSGQPARRAEPRRNSGSDARQAPSVDRRRVETPGVIEARRARPAEVQRNVVPDSRNRGDLPVDVSPRRSSDAADGRRAEPSRDRPQYEARPSRPSDDRAAPAQRAEPRGERASPPPSRSGGGDYDGGRRPSGGDSDGGRRSSGGSWGGSGGGSASRGDVGGGRGAGGGGGGGRRR